MSPDNLISLARSGMPALQNYLENYGSPIFRGIEKEGLRCTPAGDIAQSPHPEALGHPLTHASITTDYSEALLELITGVSNSRDALLDELKEIHQYVQANLGDELLWAGSMPCRLHGEESIRIAEYGASNIGQLKHVYRQGLGVRYGRIMQSIAGLHFNFSLDDRLWEQLRSDSASELSLKDFKSAGYFALIRNFRRWSWLLMYLFGASPGLDKSFLNDESQAALEKCEDSPSRFREEACSLRMSDLGYHNNAQADLNICFNTLDNFTHTLGEAIHTPYPDYEKIGTKNQDQYIQLNTNILQIENEYYSSIRPKRTTHSGEKPTQALNSRGVEYIEVRCLDLNPMLPLGIDKIEIDFLDVFLLHCLVSPSAYIDEAGCQALDENFRRVVNEGRSADLLLNDEGKDRNLKEWGLSLIAEMQALAALLDQNFNDARYQTALEVQTAKLKDVSQTPSAQVLAQMQAQQYSWINLGLKFSAEHKETLTSTEAMSPETDKAFTKQAELSISAAREIEADDTLDFEAFLQNYLQH